MRDQERTNPSTDGSDKKTAWGPDPGGCWFFVFAVAEIELPGNHAEIVGFARVHKHSRGMHVTRGQAARLAAVSAAGEPGAETPQLASSAEAADDEPEGPEYDAELMSMFVLAEHRDLGIGTRLFAQAVQDAQAELVPCRTIITWCLDDEASRTFYQSKCGGVAIGLKVDKDGVPGARDGRERTQTAFAFDLRQAQQSFLNTRPAPETISNAETRMGGCADFLGWASVLDGVQLACGAELRLLSATDADPMFDACLANADFLRPFLNWVDSAEDVERWLTDPVAKAAALAEHTGFVAETLEEMENGKHLAVGVWDPPTIGDGQPQLTGVRKLRGLVEVHQIDAENERAGISYWRGDQEPRIKGMMTQAVQHIAELVLSPRGEGSGFPPIRRLQFNVAVDNAPSIALAERVGARREGVLREYEKLHGLWIDH
eukprot:SAG31_NODE_7125_length_1782_cov_1.783720_1_plen_430_part_10